MFCSSGLRIISCCRIDIVVGVAFAMTFVAGIPKGEVKAGILDSH